MTAVADMALPAKSLAAVDGVHTIVPASAAVPGLLGPAAAPSVIEIVVPLCTIDELVKLTRRLAPLVLM